ncbi:AP-4 complex subunit epsilon-1, variant 2 [Chamberlinius hualienensis]
MMGYSANFLYFHSVKLAQQGSLLEKRMGYLSATLFLNGEHELTLLLVNTILKDLKSSDLSEVNMALTAACCLANREMASVLIDTVQHLMHSHPKAVIRKKAFLAFKRLLQINSTFGSDSASIAALKKCIEDRDIEVVSTVILSISHAAKINPSIFKDLLEPCLDILRQILQRKFSPDYDYYSLPAPWLQIEILKLLPILSSGKDASLSEILEEVLKNTDTNHTVSNAILYQCICAIVSIPPLENLLETASTLISRFLHSSNSDMKYMGLKALTLMVNKVHPKYASTHQHLIIESLKHPDASIRSKTFDLLICLVNAANIHVVWPKLMKHLDTTADECMKEELGLRCLYLLQSHSPDTVWTFEKTISLILMSPPHTHLQFISQLNSLLCKETISLELTCSAVNISLDILGSTVPSSDLIHFCCWVLSEFHQTDVRVALSLLSQSLKKFMSDHQVLLSLLLAIKRLLIKHTDFSIDPEVEEYIQSCSASSHCMVRQLSKELYQILNNLENVRQSFKTSIVHYDWTLSFLDSFIENALTSDSPYLPLSVKNSIVKEDLPIKSSNGSSSYTRSSASSTPGSLLSGFNLDNTERIWTKDGFQLDKQTPIQLRRMDNDDVVSVKSEDPSVEDDNELIEALFSKSTDDTSRPLHD